MATFTGNSGNNTANAAGGVLVGFTGGTLAQLQDGNGDTINGLGGNDFIFGGSGNDVINAGSASEFGTRHDIVVGGAGNDTFNVDAANALTTIVIYSFEGGGNGITANLQTGTATDTFGDTDTLNGVHFIVATDLDDSLTGSAGDDVLAPGRGTDTVNGNGGHDILAYSFIADGLGGGSDGFDFTVGITVTMTGEDAGTVTSTDGVNTTFTDIDVIAGTRFDDVFNGGAGNDDFEGGEGADQFNGGGGTDHVSYAREYLGGSDSGVSVDLANNTATDSFGDTDTLTSIENVTGTQFDDTLLGDGANNVLKGLGGNDFIRGGGGNDTIDAGASADTGTRHNFVVGDAGDDTFNVEAANALTTIVAYALETGGNGITVNLQTGTATDTFGDTDTLNGVRFVAATDNSDSLTGSTGDDILAPGRGTDTVNGNGGHDVLAYYFIADGQGGGGDGFNFTAGITVNMTGEDAGTVTSTDGVNTTFTDIDIIAGTRFGDIFNGGAGDDDFEGGEGNDEFNGGAGTDHVSYEREYIGGGNSGVSINLANGTGTDSFGDTDTFDSIENVTGTQFADTLTGTAGNNTFMGLAGKDVLVGGTGHDLLYGGADADRFEFDSIKDSVKGSKRDNILDFSHQDDIDLRTIDAQSGSGNQKFKWVGKDAFSHAKGELRYIDKGSTCIVQGDVNGDAKADFEIFVKISSMTKGDFLL